VDFSLADHPEVERNILRILNGSKVKFNQQLHPMTFKMNISRRFYRANNMFICVQKKNTDLQDEGAPTNFFPMTTGGPWIMSVRSSGIEGM
jgi:hypothetical protein